MFRRNKSKTAEYISYQEEFNHCVMLEEKTDKPIWPYSTEPVRFDIEVGLSSKLADLDNVLKPLFDTYQTIYEEFNDKTVYEIRATKYLVPKGDEYVSVEVRPTASEISEEPKEEG